MQKNYKNITGVLSHESYKKLYDKHGVYFIDIIREDLYQLPNKHPGCHHMIDEYNIPRQIYNICWHDWTHVVFVSNKIQDLEEVKKKQPYIECILYSSTSHSSIEKCLTH